MMLRYLLALVLSFGATASHAAFANAVPPTGWGGSPGAWTYGGTPAANFPWVNGSAAGGATVNVGGRAVTMPATYRFAANAPSVIARAALATPYGRAASFIAWAVAAGWAWSEAEQRWLAPAVQAAYADTVYFWVLGSSENPRYHSIGELCNAQSGTAYNGATRLVAGSSAAWPGSQQCQVYTDAPGTNPDYWANVNQGVIARPGYTCGDVYSTHPTGAKVSVPQGHACPTGVMHPADDEDADVLPDLAPMPADVPAEADDYIPLPMQNPELEPVRVPMGAPVPVANTNPQAYDQPVADVWPAPSTDEPFRVDVQPGTVRGTSPTGVTDVEHLGGGAAPPAEPASSPGLCAEFPDIAACQRLGVATSPGAIPTQDVPLTFDSPVSFGPSDAACPAPRVMQTSLAGSLELSYEGACMFADGVRPIVIAMAYLASIFAFFGIGSRD